ncbi:MAG: phytanoyl-CoA dioxygenase family protein [Chloroflexi bacterium]|nr:phytanoyl-CoA dioxygenase family protein [Chloroflexota bacterium]
MGLTEQQLRFYRTFGFLKFPGLFAAEIGAITDAFEEVWAASGRTHDHVKRSMLIPFVDSHPYLSALLDDPRIDETAAAILGDDYNYETSDGNYYVGDTKWHSDKEPDDPHESFKIAFYLDPVTEATGALRVIPGSTHRGDAFLAMLHEAVPFTFASRPDESWGVAGADVPAYACESQPGDMLLFNHRIKHSSWGGGDRRRMFTFNFEARYAAADLPVLRQKMAAESAAREATTQRAYGEAMLRTAGPARMRHLEQRLAVEEQLRGG